MLYYGFNKVFKCQFFLPEPNTLFTTVGETSKDLLFWTVMGSSYGYTVFGGILELIAASLLLHPKSRLVGMLLCAGVLSNIVAINFGFNISVKFYSSLFLLLSLIWIAPYGNMLYRFFIHQQLVQTQLWQDPRRPSLHITKIIIVWCLLLECLSPYIALQNFNDDNFPRPPFHGAYEVLDINSNWQRVFVHRRGYFILQDKNGQMHDFKFAYDETQQVFQLTEIPSQQQFFIHYQKEANKLQLNGEKLGHIMLQKIDLSRLPLLQEELDWRID